MEAIDQLIAEPGNAALKGGANQAFDQGGHQAHQGDQQPGAAALEQTQLQGHQGHQGAAGQAREAALEADGPLGAGGNGPQAGDEHRVAPPALADLTATGIGELGAETGGKSDQQQGHWRPGKGAEQGQASARGGRAPNVLGPATATAALGQAQLLLAAQAQAGDQGANQQIQHHRQPAGPTEAAPEQGAEDAGMDPARFRQQGCALGQGNQQAIEQQGIAPLQQPLRRLEKQIRQHDRAPTAPLAEHRHRQGSQPTPRPGVG